MSGDGVLDVRAFQRSIDDWCRRNFGDRESLAIDALVVAEEVGELCRAIVKQAQGIRGTSDQWQAEIRKEIGDIVIALASFASNAGVDLYDVVIERWAVVGQRDFTVDKIGHGMPA